MADETPEPAAVDADPAAAQPPPTEQAEESTWLLHYAGTEPLTLGETTWEPDGVQRLPESVARGLVGSHNLRVVQDEDVFNQIRARPARP
jgi:hypothetical protein